MSATTRRGFLGGAIAAAATPAVAHAAPERLPGIVPAKQPTVRRGRAIAVSPRTGAKVVAHAGCSTIAVRHAKKTRIVDVGGHPVELAIAPGGRLAAVTTGFWAEPGLAIVDLHGKPSVKRIDVGASPFGVTFTDDGDHLLVTGGEERGEITVIDVRRRKVLARRPIGACPRGVAIAGDDRAWVAVNGEDRLVLVDARSCRALRSLKVPALPERAAVSRDGRRLLVSHGGRDGDRVSEVTVRGGKVRRHHAGRLPSGVAFSREGRMVVALGGEGRIAVISERGHVVRREIGGAPRGLAIAGGRAWTADSLTGRPRSTRL